MRERFSKVAIALSQMGKLRSIEAAAAIALMVDFPETLPRLTDLLTNR